MLQSINHYYSNLTFLQYYKYQIHNYIQILSRLTMNYLNKELQYDCKQTNIYF